MKAEAPQDGTEEQTENEAGCPGAQTHSEGYEPQNDPLQHTGGDVQQTAGEDIEHGNIEAPSGNAPRSVVPEPKPNPPYDCGSAATYGRRWANGWEMPRRGKHEDPVRKWIHCPSLGEAKPAQFRMTPFKWLENATNSYQDTPQKMPHVSKPRRRSKQTLSTKQPTDFMLGPPPGLGLLSTNAASSSSHQGCRFYCNMCWQEHFSWLPRHSWEPGPEDTYGMSYTYFPFF